MRWTRVDRGNIEDRRGRRVSPGGTIGCGTLLFLVVLSVVFKQDLVSLLGPAVAVDSGPAESGGDFRTTPEEEELVDFMAFVLDDLQKTWGSQLGSTYRQTSMVLFRDAVQSACGIAGAATGPFYCPGDEKVFLDLSFFAELHRQFGAPGDFAQAYVVAHEVGHHIQNVLGIERQVRQMQMARPGAQNELSVRMELQADCFAGVWGHAAAERGLLERGDVDEGLNAAASIGDDRIQRQTQGYVTPDAFTHGSSAQRVEWFRRGLSTGDPESCDTFS